MNPFEDVSRPTYVPPPLPTTPQPAEETLIDTSISIPAPSWRGHQQSDSFVGGSEAPAPVQKGESLLDMPPSNSAPSMLVTQHQQPPAPPTQQAIQQGNMAGSMSGSMADSSMTGSMSSPLSPGPISSAPLPPGPGPAFQTTDSPTDDLPRTILMMRLYNMGLAVFMSFSAFMSLLGDDFPSAVLACYIMSFSTLICCFETHLKGISMSISANFGFMYNARARAAFFVFVALLCFSQGILGKIAGFGMLVNAAFSFYVIFRHPEYEEIHRKYGMVDGGDILRERGVNWARSNPEAVQGAVRGGAEWALNNQEFVRDQPTQGATENQGLLSV